MMMMMMMIDGPGTISGAGVATWPGGGGVSDLRGPRFLVCGRDGRDGVDLGILVPWRIGGTTPSPISPFICDGLMVSKACY